MSAMKNKKLVYGILLTIVCFGALVGYIFWIGDIYQELTCYQYKAGTGDEHLGIPQR